MATNPNILPCPKCGSADHLDVYSYDNGWRHVECTDTKCLNLGPGAGNIREAIKLWNEKARATPQFTETTDMKFYRDGKEI